MADLARGKWEQGVDYQIAALQAVNADSLDGDTLHHALGLRPFIKGKKGNHTSSGNTPSEEAAKRVAQWKWLIIDEISMVNGMKRDKDMIDRPFGGLNVLFAGDFYQLDPPTGTPLNRVPVSWIRKAKQYAPSAAEDHGQQIFWGSGKGALQGMTELTECKRLKDTDEWLLHVQNQFRHGTLTEDNHAFLHGRPTRVAGSYMQGTLACKNAHCIENEHLIAQDNSLECDYCKNERCQRHL
eukprot:1330964-Karenia_brevis.AAC.1